MENFNQREYQTVLLAALLHDVGKRTASGLGKYKLRIANNNLAFEYT